MSFDDFGTLRVRATSASGALPISGAIIHVIGADEENLSFAKSLVTDKDGITPKIDLPTPKKSYSLTPEEEKTPYALYDVEAIADGYYTKRIVGVAIFSGINAILPLNMIPSSLEPIENFPKGNVNATLDE